MSYTATHHTASTRGSVQHALRLFLSFLGFAAIFRPPFRPSLLTSRWPSAISLPEVHTRAAPHAGGGRPSRSRRLARACRRPAGLLRRRCCLRRPSLGPCRCPVGETTRQRSAAARCPRPARRRWPRGGVARRDRRTLTRRGRRTAAVARRGRAAAAQTAAVGRALAAQRAPRTPLRRAVASRASSTAGSALPPGDMRCGTGGRTRARDRAGRRLPAGTCGPLASPFPLAGVGQAAAARLRPPACRLRLPACLGRAAAHVFARLPLASSP